MNELQRLLHDSRECGLDWRGLVRVPTNFLGPSMSESTKNIVLIEDDVALNRLLVDQISRLGFNPVGAHNVSEAEAAIQTIEPALVLLDPQLPDSIGLDAIGRFHEVCPVVILTANGSIDQAVQAVKAGASDYLIKPVSQGHLKIAIRRAMETANMRRKMKMFETQDLKFNLSFASQPTLEELKKEYFQKMLAAHDGNRSKAARAMGISERSLYRFVARLAAGGETPGD